MLFVSSFILCEWGGFAAVCSSRVSTDGIEEEEKLRLTLSADVCASKNLPFVFNQFRNNGDLCGIYCGFYVFCLTVFDYIVDTNFEVIATRSNPVECTAKYLNFSAVQENAQVYASHYRFVLR